MIYTNIINMHMPSCMKKIHDLFVSREYDN
jgi:hypothetical protein